MTEEDIRDIVRGALEGLYLDDFLDEWTEKKDSTLEIETFEEVKLVTVDTGLVIRINGEEFYVSIRKVVRTPPSSVEEER